MPNSELAEIYFVAGMMIIILIISIAATYVFVRQYRREKGNENQPGSKNDKDTPDSK